MLAINFILNGIPRKTVADPKKSLHKVIEGSIKLTGTNEGCFTGYCDTCAVIIGNKTIISCKHTVAKACREKITTMGNLLFRMVRFIVDPVIAVIATLERGVGTFPSKIKVTYGTSWAGSDPGKRFKGKNHQSSVLLCWGRS